MAVEHFFPWSQLCHSLSCDTPAAVLLVLPHVIAKADIRLPIFSAITWCCNRNQSMQSEVADPEERISVTSSWGSEVTTAANEEGRWQIFLKHQHSTGHYFTSVENSVSLMDVAIREVWHNGQSNMGWALGNCFDSDAEAKQPTFPISGFQIIPEHWHQPLEESRDRLSEWVPAPRDYCHYIRSFVPLWQDASANTRRSCRHHCQAYVTPIEGWMPAEIQRNDKRTRMPIAQLDRNSRRFDRDEHSKPTDRAHLYQQKIAAGETMKNQWKPLQPPFITKPANLGHQYPTISSTQ